LVINIQSIHDARSEKHQVIHQMIWLTLVSTHWSRRSRYVSIYLLSERTVLAL